MSDPSIFPLKGGFISTPSRGCSSLKFLERVSRQKKSRLLNAVQYQVHRPNSQHGHAGVVVIGGEGFLLQEFALFRGEVIAHQMLLPRLSYRMSGLVACSRTY